MPELLRVIKTSDFKGTSFVPGDFPRYRLCDVRLLWMLERQAVLFGVKPRLGSTYRTPAENLAAGGATGSLHQFGLAVDYDLPGVPVRKSVAALLDDTRVGGVGLQYPSRAHHADLGRRRTWGEVVTVNDAGDVIKDHNNTLESVLSMFGPEPGDVFVGPGLTPAVFANAKPWSIGLGALGLAAFLAWWLLSR